MRFLADGVTEDLILKLGRFRRLFVSSRTANAVLQDGKADPVAIGDALGVRYVLSGTLRRTGERVRMNLSLTETDEGRIVWNKRIERPFATLLDTLDKIVAHIAATVIGRLEEADIAAARRQRPESMSAYECHLRSLELHRLGEKLARAALAVQPDLTVEYVREQEWYRDRAVLDKLMQRLVAAGIPERH